MEASQRERRDPCVVPRVARESLLGAILASSTESHMRVALFVTCLVDLVWPEVGVATARVIQRAGHEVIFPVGQTCCGQPAFNSGYRREAREVLRHTVASLAGSGADAIVTPAGSCAAMLRECAPQLLPPPEAAMGTQVIELTEFLARHGADIAGHLPRPTAVAYHHSCHMLRLLGLEDAPMQALKRIGNVELVSWDSRRCCGFGGLFSVKQPELSVAMTDEKLESLAGGDIVCGADPSCLLQLRSRLKARGLPNKVLHIAQLLEQATRP
jgi:L-lactate dehydrogenase complex protein LldE